MNDPHDHLQEQVKNTRILLYALIIALIIGVIGLGMSLKNLKRDVTQKENQISVLTDEIGDLKEENLKLYENIISNIELVQRLKNTFVNNQESPDTQNNELIDNLEENKENLLKLLQERELAINNLQNTNERLRQENSYQSYSEEIINILILGTNENLTDTIIIANINPERETITLVSLPRDLYVNGRKINAIYQLHGIEKFERDIHTITGLTINKYIVVDFSSFVEVVDILGGIDLYVTEDIYDPSFPGPGSTYQAYSIKAGSHHFDGEEALRYVRSRKSTSDFDRSKRQQQVLTSLRTKVKKINLLSDLNKVAELYDVVTKQVDTDIGMFEAIDFLDQYQNFAFVTNNVISTSNLLYSSQTIDGQYILLPQSGDYIGIKKYISELINK